jgi:hypothetical protein
VLWPRTVSKRGIALVAQRILRLATNQEIVGSNPAERTLYSKPSNAPDEAKTSAVLLSGREIVNRGPASVGVMPTYLESWLSLV